MAKVQNYIEVEESRADFIPYACHFDAETILTKNGELLQTIKIEGYQFDVFVDGKKLDIRALVREAFLENALHPHIAAHFHIIRRPRDLSPNNTQSGYFANSVNAAWEKKHHWQNSYSNDLYITLIHEGTNFNLKNIGQVTRSFLFLPEKSAQQKILEKAKDTLGKITTQFLEKLAPLKPRKLHCVEKNGAYYSEQLGLLHNLVNLETGHDIAMPISDISDYLCSNEIDIDFYTIHSKSEAGKHRFSAIYSIKQYAEMSPSSLDTFLQFQGEFIISQQVMLGAEQSFIESLEHKSNMANLHE
jgi:type IV secretion system protein VirB4